MINPLYLAAGDTFLVFDPADDIEDTYPDPELARKRAGANGFLFYNLNDKINFNASLGYQSSEVISSNMSDIPSAYSGRLSSTGYFDLKGQVYGLRFQVNGLSGWQDIVRRDTGFKIDIQNINASAEYDINIKGLNIRPGITYQKGYYDDMPYLRYKGQGFLNGAGEITSTAFSLRTDYTLMKSLRLIAAVRGEKYSTNDDLYFSYQFIGSYNLNDQHNIRFVYSRANRGPFIIDVYSNYLWNRFQRPPPGYIYFQGNKDIEMLTMDMYELGYRVKPVKSIVADLEFFWTKTKDYSLLWPDSVNIFHENLPTNRPYARMLYQNIDLSSEQKGVTASITWVVNQNLNAKVFGTYSKTKLYDYYPLTPEETMALMFEDAYSNGLVDLNGDNIPEDFTGDGYPDPYPPYFIDLNGDGIPEDFTGDGVPDMLQTTPYSTVQPDTIVKETDHLSTPDFYGGLVINYSTLKNKLNITPSAYFYTEQTLINKNGGEQDIEGKYIINLKASYEIWKESTVYINARNLLNNDKREFAFMDDIGGIYLIGVNIVF
jgi:iron complex outermembrane receptor protein